MQKQAGWSRLLLGGIEAYFGAVAKTLAKSEPFTASARMIEMPDRKQMASADDDDGGPK